MDFEYSTKKKKKKREKQYKQIIIHTVTEATTEKENKKHRTSIKKDWTSWHNSRQATYFLYSDNIEEEKQSHAHTDTEKIIM